MDVITPQHGQKAAFEKAPQLFHSEADKLVAKVFKPVDKTAEIDYERYRGGLIVHERPSWLHQFKVLTRRCMLDNLRSWPILVTLMVQNTIMAILIGGAFFQVGNEPLKRQALMFFVVINQGVFAALSVINSFPSERLLVLRERAAGTYNVSAYFLAKNVADLILQIPGPIVFSPIVYFMAGLQPVASKFFLFMFFMILDSLTATSLALMVSALARTTSLSVTVLPMTLEICRLFGGYFLSPANLLDVMWFCWLDALSYVKYCYVGVALNELHDGLTDSERHKKIEELGLDYITIGGCIGALFAFIIGFRVIAYLGIRYIKW
jgi:ATP-binding cassette subfamily G (WHITE) protein 2